MNTLNSGQQEFVNNLLSSLEKNQVPWQPSWDRTIIRPYNVISLKHYQGVNELNLWMTALHNGYEDPRWMTFKQANEKGYRIKKGSVGTYVFNYALRNLETKKLVTMQEYQKLSDEEKENIKPFSKTYKVFNGTQIDGIPTLDVKEKQIIFENEKAAAFIDDLLKNIELKVTQFGDRAFYRPSEDKVYLPKQDAFIDEQSFYAVELHEIAHATSHPTRLNREISTDNTSNQYAMEELKAELSSAFLTLDLGFHFDQFHEDNHTAYIQSWIQQIKDNPHVIFSSINEAQKIRQYILDKGGYSKIYTQDSTLKKSALTEDGYQPGSLDNVSKNSLEEYPYTFNHILVEKETVILYKLGVPINVQCGLIDKDNNYYTNTQLEELTRNMSIDDDFAWQKNNGIETAGHRISKEEDLIILKDHYAHGYIDPSFISFDQMTQFINTFEYLTDQEYYILDENTCNRIQEEMVANAPLTLEKLINFKNQYLTSEVIETAATKKEWVSAAKRENMNSLDFLKENINLHLNKSEQAIERALNYLSEDLTNHEPSRMDEIGEALKMDTPQEIYTNPNLNNEISTDLDTLRFFKQNKAFLDNHLTDLSILSGIYAITNTLSDSLVQDIAQIAKESYLNSEIELEASQFGTSITEAITEGNITIDQLKQMKNSEISNAAFENHFKQPESANEPSIEKKIEKKDISLEEMKNSVSIVDYANTVLGLNVIKETRGLFRLENYDSCKIYPNNTFFRYSQNVGGSIIDFIKHFESCDTKEAILKIKEYYINYHPTAQFDTKMQKHLSNSRYVDDIELPEKAETNKHVYAYLTKTRGIKPSIVNDYINRKVLYEDTRQNCVFTGKVNGKITYATLRSSSPTSNFKQDIAGSVKEVGIYIDNDSDTLVLNEAVIDQMSYMSLATNPEVYNYLSVCGAANTINALRFHMIKRESSNLRRVIIGLDNDKAGEINTLKTIDYLKENFPDIDICVHSPEGKDFNDQLKLEMHMLSASVQEETNKQIYNEEALKW